MGRPDFQSALGTPAVKHLPQGGQFLGLLERVEKMIADDECDKFLHAPVGLRNEITGPAEASAPDLS